MDKSIFSDAFISEGVPESLKIINKKLEKYFNEKDPEMLRVANRYIYLNYYLYNSSDYIENILSNISCIQYNGDVEVWDYITYSLVLYMRIKQKSGDLEATQKIRDKIFYPHTLITDEVKIRKKQKKLKRVLEGDLLTPDKVDECIKNGWTDLEFSCRLGNLIQLTYISSLGGSELLPVTKVEKEIEENIMAMRRLIDKGADISKALT